MNYVFVDDFGNAALVVCPILPQSSSKFSKKLIEAAHAIKHLSSNTYIKEPKKFDVPEGDVLLSYAEAILGYDWDGVSEVTHPIWRVVGYKCANGFRVVENSLIKIREVVIPVAKMLQAA